MNKFIPFLLSFIPIFAFAQSFAPAPGNIGTTAISKDSSCFVAWATGGQLFRGFININDTTATYNDFNRASFGSLPDAFGSAEGDGTSVVSLGDSGIAILTFDFVIQDRNGYDFAIFENGFQNGYMELGHVEVSSDGIHFFRFPSISEVPTNTQLGNASVSDCGYVNNLAGKYRAGFGTPFDLSELPNDAFLDKNQITHVKIVDAIGAISGTHTTADSQGNTINDTYPTPFHSGGFDLDAIGIINGTLAIKEEQLFSSVFPNPTLGLVNIQLRQACDLLLYSVEGKVLWQGKGESALLDLNQLHLTAGSYFLNASNQDKSSTIRIQFQN